MFAIAPTVEPNGERTVGVLVEDLDAACAELRAADVADDDSIAANDRFRLRALSSPGRQALGVGRSPKRLIDSARRCLCVVRIDETKNWASVFASFCTGPTAASSPVQRGP